MCIYSDQRPFIMFIAILSIDKEPFCIKPPEFNLEDMNAKLGSGLELWVMWFVQLLGGCFHQESDYPTFYHLAVLDFKPCYDI